MYCMYLFGVVVMHVLISNTNQYISIHSRWIASVFFLYCIYWRGKIRIYQYWSVFLFNTCKIDANTCSIQANTHESRIQRGLVCIRQYWTEPDLYLNTDCMYIETIQTNPFTMHWLLFVRIDVFSSVLNGSWFVFEYWLYVFQYSYNTDQFIHDVLAGIRAYWRVFVSIERGLICIWILTVCLRFVFEKTLVVLVCIESVLKAQIRIYW